MVLNIFEFLGMADSFSLGGDAAVVLACCTAAVIESLQRIAGTSQSVTPTRDAPGGLLTFSPNRLAPRRVGCFSTLVRLAVEAA